MNDPEPQSQSRGGDRVARRMASAALCVSLLFLWGWFDAHQKMRHSQSYGIQLEGRLANTLQAKAVDAGIQDTLLQKLGLVKTAHHGLMRRMSLLTNKRADLGATVEAFYEMQVARHVIESSLSSLRNDRLSSTAAAGATGSGSEDADTSLAEPGDGTELKSIRQQIAGQEDLIRRLILEAATKQRDVTALQAEFDTLAAEFSTDLQMLETAMRDHLVTVAAPPIGLAAVGGQ